MHLRSLFIFGVSSLVVACAAEPTTHVEDQPGVRNAAYKDAAAKYGIDEDWLVAIGYQQGRFELAQGQDATPDPAIDMADPDSALLDDTPVVEADDSAGATDDPTMAPDVPSYGLMYLSDAQIDRAAALIGVPSDTIKTDYTANIDGAAAILADDAHTLGSLRDATSAFLGVQDDAAELALNQLDDAIAQGFDVTTTDGERLVLDGTGAALIEDPISPDDETDADPSTARAKPAPGKMPAFQWIKSPNFGSRLGYKINYVVIHDMEGTMPGAIAVFKNPANETSAHYLVRSRDGHIVKMVYEHDEAWHAGHGWFNRHSIGIEHEGFAHKKNGGGYYNDTLYTASSELTCSIAHRYGIPVDRKHIFGHENVPSSLSSHTLCSDARGNRGECGGVSHHSDPGQYWNWKKYMNLVSTCVKAAKS
ncbi:MAG: N-acetylmuramoyl-L-alanine amidase [Kofleriaceae bacterium]